MLYGDMFRVTILFPLIVAMDIPYTNALTITIELLAIVFLLTSVALLMRSSVLSRNAPAGPLPSRKYQHRPFAFSLFVLVFPIILIFMASATYAINGIPGPLITPTPTSETETPPLLPPSISPPQNLASSGTLTVAANPIYRPEIYRDKAGVVGFDVELSTNLARVMGLHTRTVPVSRYQDLLSKLNTRTVDIVLSAYSLTDDVKSSVQSIPYLAPRGVLLVRPGNPLDLHFKTLKDLCGHKIGVQSGSWEQRDVESIQCDQTPQDANRGILPLFSTFPDADTLMHTLINKQVDAIYQRSPTVSYYQQKYAKLFQPVGQVTLPQEGILIRSEDAKIYQAVQASYNLLVTNGTYASLLQKWGLTEDTIVPLTPTPPHSFNPVSLLSVPVTRWNKRYES